jgi:hypothetical protein
MGMGLGAPRGMVFFLGGLMWQFDPSIFFRFFMVANQSSSAKIEIFMKSITIQYPVIEPNYVK